LYVLKVVLTNGRSKYLPVPKRWQENILSLKLLKTEVLLCRKTHA
jgi:hypothetical protein